MVDAVGEARSNADVFGELCARLGLLSDDEPAGELDLMLDVLNRLPPAIGEPLRAGDLPTPSFGVAPVQFVDVFPNTPDRKVHLFPAALEAEAPMGLYRFQPDPGTERYPLALISPASDRTISSTLGELPRPDVKLIMHPDDAAARGLADDDLVRVFNELGEVHCILDIDAGDPSGDREPAERHLAPQHAQRRDRHRARAGHAHRSRRRRLLQRRARAGRVARRLRDTEIGELRSWRTGESITQLRQFDLHSLTSSSN